VSSELPSPARDIIIACAGGFGRECRDWLRLYEPGSRFLGFIDDPNAESCLGSIECHQPRIGVTYLIANGEGKHRSQIGEALRAKGSRVGSMISPMAQLGTRLGDEDAALVLGNASLGPNCQIGPYVLVQGFACVGHDVTIGQACTIHSFAFIGGWVTLGDGVTVNPHAVILPRMSIGDSAVIGAGAVVTRDVPPGATVFGVPAKVICQA